MGIELMSEAWASLCAMSRAEPEGKATDSPDQRRDSIAYFLFSSQTESETEIFLR